MSEPSWEEIQSLTTIAKKLNDEDAAIVILALCQWAQAAGFSKGVLAVLEIENEGK